MFNLKFSYYAYFNFGKKNLIKNYSVNFIKVKHSLFFIFLL